MQIFRNVPASKFARPPDRPYRCEILLQGSRGFYVRAYRALLPPHAPDMLTVRIQVIDGTGTFTLSDSQPCRLLTSLRGHYSASSLLRTQPPPSRLRPTSRFRRLYGLPCSDGFAPGRGGLLQLLGMSLSPCCRFHPAEVNIRIGQSSAAHAAFALRLKARPSEILTFEATTLLLLLRPGDS